MLRALLLVVCVSAFSNAFAATELNPSARKPVVQFADYYLIGDPTTKPTSLDVTEFLAVTLPAAEESLLNWVHQNAPWMAPKEAYDRHYHFGTWLKDPADRSCLTTREKVLVRDSSRTVDLGPTGCKVKSGEWDDPYAGDVHYKPSEIQIDHAVPLKNAYISGASKWDAKTRCVYTNFLANKFHLISVDGYENQSKGDKDPSQWMPTDENYHCQYLKNWLSVKMIWGLVLSADEVNAIKTIVKDRKCNINSLVMSKAELAKQRKAIQDKFEMCE